MDIWMGAPANEAERQETLRMTARAFRGNDNPETVAGFQNDHDRPGFRLELHRILKLNGRIVAGVLVVDKDLRVGRSVLRCGGIADVATDPTTRMKGLGRRLMEHCVEWMTEQGFHVTMLYGIVDYYHKFGYRPAGCSSAVTLSVSDAAHASAGNLRRRALRRRDLPAVARLHDRADRLVPLSFVRSPEYWDYLWKRFRGGGALWTAAGNLAGAWSGEPKDSAYVVREIAVDLRASAMAGLLAGCAQAAKRVGAERIRFDLSTSHPFARFCREYGAEWSVRYPRNGGCMVRILDLPATLQRMLPELNVRWARTPVPETPPAVTLATDLGTVTLLLGKDPVTLAEGRVDASPRVRLDQGRLAQLLCGYRGIDDLAALPDVSCPARARAALRALFPEGCPFTWGADHF